MTEPTANLTHRQASPASSAARDAHEPEHSWRKVCWDVFLAVALAILFAAVFAVLVDRWLHPDRDACDVAISKAAFSGMLTNPAVLNCVDHPRKRVEVRV